MTRATVSQADLGDKIQEIIDRIQHGEVVVVGSSGEEQAVILDPLDYRLLWTLAQCAIGRARQGHGWMIRTLEPYGITSMTR